MKKPTKHYCELIKYYYPREIYKNRAARAREIERKRERAKSNIIFKFFMLIIDGSKNGRRKKRERKKINK